MGKERWAEKAKRSRPKEEATSLRNSVLVLSWRVLGVLLVFSMCVSTVSSSVLVVSVVLVLCNSRKFLSLSLQRTRRMICAKSRKHEL